MRTIIVNPSEIRKGDKVLSSATGSKPHAVRNAGPCPSKPEMWHIDGDCYDIRFSTVIKVV